jgi:hypothetical protein
MNLFYNLQFNSIPLQLSLQLFSYITHIGKNYPRQLLRVYSFIDQPKPFFSLTFAGLITTSIVKPKIQPSNVFSVL